jgi:hypothetical protein
MQRPEHGPPFEVSRQREGSERLRKLLAARLDDRSFALPHWSFAKAAGKSESKDYRANCDYELFQVIPLMRAPSESTRRFAI